MDGFAIGGRRIGAGERPYVLAELACAHEGDADRARALTELAIEAGAEGVQFQLFQADMLASPRIENHAVLRGLELPYAVWGELIGRVKAAGRQAWANVFDESAVAAAADGGADVLKLHSSDLSNPRMLDAVAAVGRPVSLAVGGSRLDEVGWAVERLRAGGADRLVLMHGFQAYPTAPGDARLGYIETLRRVFGGVVGYQDHTDGGDPLAVVLPLVAAGCGAAVLEKHIIDDRSKRGIDHEAALDPGPFAEFVRQVGAVHEALGDGTVGPLSAAELTYRKRMKKTAVAARSIAAGEVLRPEAVAYLRSEGGMLPVEAERLIGRRARQAIEVWSPLEREWFAGVEGDVDG